MEQFDLDVLGVLLKNSIIFVAEFLTLSESRPGLIAGALVVFLSLFAVAYFRRTSRQLRAISAFDMRVKSYGSIENFASSYSDFQHDLKENFRKVGPREALWEAWDEFSETIVPDDEVDGILRLRNSIRPSTFLNIEDLGFGPGSYRILPNIFVSAGLFLTFLGLVAALDQFSKSMNFESGSMNDAMQDFMQIASAKFVMSLVGLLCSIIFTVLLRRRQNLLDQKLHRLCLNVERRLVFVSLEDIGFRQLKAATEQREHLREIGMGMVAELQKPLEALPEKITGAIAERMDPIFDRVSAMGATNMEGLVGDLSSQLSSSVGQALTRASESLGEATDRMGEVVNSMSNTNADAGKGLQDALVEMSRAVSEMRSEVADSGKTAANAMNEGAEQLLGVMNETLEGIKDNTGKGAEAMRLAADDMRNAAEGFEAALTKASEEGAEAARAIMAQSSEDAEQAIQAAGRSLLDSFASTSGNIAKLGEEMGVVVGDSLISQLEAIGSKFEEFSDALENGTIGAKKAASGMNDSADVMKMASDNFSTASQDLVSATEPVRKSHDRIEFSITKMNETVQTISNDLLQHSKSIAEKSRTVLETAETALGTEREGIQRTLEATRSAIAQLSDEAENLDKIDEMLGRALTQYNLQLEAALGNAQDHVGQMRDALAPGLDTLRSVVEQAENFLPSQGRTKR